MQKITCAIIDDEPIARKGLMQYVGKIDFLDLVGTMEDAVQLNNFLTNHTVDLLFLDIEMPSITGVEWLQQASHPPRVIFTTAYEQYALEGFKLDVLDYLLKPISFERFLKAANKAADYFRLVRDKGEVETHYFFVRAEGRFEKVQFADILYVEAMENYQCIHTSTQKLMVLMTQKALMEKLPAEQFLQPHKSFIVARHHISAVGQIEVWVGDKSLPLSRNYREAVYQAMELHQATLNK